MPKYKVAFNIQDLLAAFISDAYCEIVGSASFEILVTTGETLSSTKIANVKKRLPFVEITQVEG